MNTAAIWTLWLITYGQGAAQPVVTPLATFPTQSECFASHDAVLVGINKSFIGSANPPSPGLMICVYGTPAKR